MEPEALGFTVVSIAGVLVLFGWFILQSVRAGRVHPGLWISTASLTIFWLEGPYDGAGYAQFHPDNWHFPAWGPLGVTHGGLPLVMPGAYVVYFVVAAMIAVRVTDAIEARRPVNRPLTLLGAGLVVGIGWDLGWEIFGTTIGLWRFARAAPGLVLFPGELNQFPVYLSVAMGIMVMTATYLLGRVGADRRSVLETWAVCRTIGRGAGQALTLVTMIVIVHVVYAATMVPIVFTNATGLQNLLADGQLYPGLENQNGPLSTIGWPLGSLVTYAVLVLVVGAIVAVVRRLDPFARTSTAPAAPTAASSLQV